MQNNINTTPINNNTNLQVQNSPTGNIPSANQPSRMQVIYKPTGQMVEIDSNKFDPKYFTANNYQGNTAVTSNPILDKLANIGSAVAPTVGMIGGGIVGSLVGTPGIGTVAGSAAGGAAGEALKEYIDQSLLGKSSQDMATNVKDTALQGAEGGVLGEVPGLGAVGGGIVKNLAVRGAGGLLAGAGSSVLDDKINNAREDTSTMVGNAAKGGIANAALMGIAPAIIGRLPILSRIATGKLSQDVISQIDRNPSIITDEAKQAVTDAANAYHSDLVYEKLFSADHAQFGKTNGLLGQDFKTALQSTPIGADGKPAQVGLDQTKNALTDFRQGLHDNHITPLLKNDKNTTVPLRDIAKSVYDLQGQIPQNDFNKLHQSFLTFAKSSGADLENPNGINIPKTLSNNGNENSVIANSIKLGTAGKDVNMVALNDFKKSIDYQKDSPIEPLYKNIKGLIEENTKDAPISSPHGQQLADQVQIPGVKDPTNIQKLNQIDNKLRQMQYYTNKVGSGSFKGMNSLRPTNIENTINKKVQSDLQPQLDLYKKTTDPAQKVNLLHNMFASIAATIGAGFGGGVGGSIGYTAGSALSRNAGKLAKAPLNILQKVADVSGRRQLTPAGGALLQSLSQSNMKDNNSNYQTP